MSEKRITQILENKINRGRFIVSSTISDYVIDNGFFYTVENVITIASAGNADIVIDPLLIPEGVSFISEPTFWNTTAGPVIITLGVADSYTGGTEITPTNRNYQGDAANTVFKTAVTPTGFAASQAKLLVGSSSTPQSSGGGSLSGENIILLDPDLIYIFNVDNQSGEEIQIGFRIEWAEIDLDLIPSGG